MRIAILGYGKMGKTIERIAEERGHEIILKATSSNPAMADQLQNADCAIEFSVPEKAIENIELCIDSNTPVIVGTTGWYDQFDTISSKVVKADGCMVHATNFSLGVNLFFKLNEQLAQLMDQFDYEPSVEEIHHTEKLDSPSGTAITLTEPILAGSRKSKWINEKSADPSTLSVISIREPNVPGTHVITYESDIDTIEIKHTAKNRNGFALGSVLAGEWSVGKTGVFTMRDVLNI